MTYNELIIKGAQYRAESRPADALVCYAQAFIMQPTIGTAYNNYGNVLREMGFPRQAIGFLQTAIAIDNNDVMAKFNLAVCYLLDGDLDLGWTQYENRWQYEHLNGMLPKFVQPRWTGQDLTGKTILVTGEQGHGDSLQFIRFIEQLKDKGARIITNFDPLLSKLFKASFPKNVMVMEPGDSVSDFDYWSPVMSLPGVLEINYQNLPHKMQYLTATPACRDEWQKKLGLKYKLRIAFTWSGRRDSWINQHKAIPFEKMLGLIQRNPEYEWINLQTDCTAEEEAILTAAGVKSFRSDIKDWHDTAGLIHHCDVVISVDTAVGHLAGALGKTFWLPLNQFAQCWRWLLNRNDSPWYPSCRIFRQPSIGNWDEPLERIHNNLKLFKI